MINQHELAQFLDAYLAVLTFNDAAPNGLQIEGKADIHHICTAVTASMDVIHQAVSVGADALLVHHGYFWKGEAQVLTGMKRQRIGQLLQHSVNLYAYHLPLDCHPELGNNACIARRLNLPTYRAHQVGQIPHLLWTGELEESIDADKLSETLFDIFKRSPQLIKGSHKKIRKLAWCSGAAQDYIVDAHRLGADAYISGEISERTYYQAKELGLHYFACGHHATERFGIQALGELLREKFSVTHQFIDSDNPI